MIRRLKELQRDTRDANKWVWQLWLEGFSADIHVWVKKRLSRPRRSNLHGSSQVISENHRIGPRSTSWAADIAAGRDQQASLYNAEPPIFDILLKAGGLPNPKSPFYSGGPIPDRELRVEQMSVARLREIVDSASDDELNKPGATGKRSPASQNPPKPSIGM